MSPEPNRGKRNRSDYIKYVIEKIALIKEVDPITVNKIVNENFFNLIRLSNYCKM